jgi:hypothetical protein
VRALTVLYDARCGLCSSARRWLLNQRQLVPLEFVADVYRGPSAWIACLWALEAYRNWSFRLAGPTLLPLARHAFEWVSTRRHSLSRTLRLVSDQDLVREVSRTGVCPQGVCTPPSAARGR